MFCINCHSSKVIRRGNWKRKGKPTRFYYSCSVCNRRWKSEEGTLTFTNWVASHGFGYYKSHRLSPCWYPWDSDVWSEMNEVDI
jgi:hypothetical protein